jgi:hypothetical protein
MKTMIPKTTKIITLAAALAVGALAATPAAAHHGRHHHHGPRVSFGLHFGAPIGWHYAPRPYYSPYYYEPRVVVVDPPPVYVERESAPVAPPAPAAAAENYWYYCNDSRAYYPYVRDCATGWQRVAPRPN